MVLLNYGFRVKCILRNCSLAIDKREFLEPLIRNQFDIFLISETKLEFSFSGSEFTIPGYRLLGKDRNQHTCDSLL